MISATCALLTFVTGCGLDVATRVDGAEIAFTDLDRRLEAFRANTAFQAYRRRESKPVADATGDLTPAFVTEVLTNDIYSLVMGAEARRRRLRIEAEDRAFARDSASIPVGNKTIFSSFPDWFRRLLLERAEIVSALQRTLESDQTPDEYWRTHQEEFEKACTRHIVVETPEEADAARERVLTGEAFADVARDVSIDSGTAPKGGDLGCNGRGDLTPELDEAAYTRPVGRVGPPIRTGEGFHLLLVESRETPPLSRISGEVSIAINRTGRDALTALVNERLKSAEVEVSERYGRWDPERLVVVP